jgi:peptidoglycan hydrolase-like protein with peptidoglycan-binding domain
MGLVLCNHGPRCFAVLFEPKNAGDDISIDASVGLRGVNRDPDVRTIQDALNRVPDGEGRASPLLEVDGVSGRKTQTAIQDFQLRHFGWKGADSRVDPNGQTIAKVNEVLGEGPVAQKLGPPPGDDTRTGPERLEFVRTLLPAVQQMIRRSRFHVTLAFPFIGQNAGAPLLAANSVAKINQHFALDRLPPARRAVSPSRIGAIYDTMLAVFVKPGGLWGPAAFDYDSVARVFPNDLAMPAYTFAGGFFMAGEKEADGTRKDSIYLLEAFDGWSRERNMLTIVHELAHFVDRRIGLPDIYGWFDTKNISQLTPERLMRRADSYANFTFDISFNRRPSDL